MTLRQALHDTRQTLRAAGVEGADSIAMLLLKETGGMAYAALVAAMDAPMDDRLLDRYRAMAKRAARGEPVQYILGHWDFYGRRYNTDARALIPRPETELLVEAALAAMPTDRALHVMDAGAGTGCIGITVKLERPCSHVALCDVSTDALALTRENAALLGAGVELLMADMRLPFPGAPYDIIVSNPPYIDAADMVKLPPNVAGYEPRLALFGGGDGLDIIRALACRAIDGMADGGRMFVEIGYNQADAAMSIFREAGMQAAVRPDYAGIPRILTARKGY